MSHSNSSLNCFANCMARYEHSYILHTSPCRPVSPHLTFGTMAHEVLYKAGKLRDEANDGVIEKGHYETIIPSELLYEDLKREFGIKSWQQYFTPIIKQLAIYEKNIVKELLNTFTGPARIEREVKLQLTVEQLKHTSFRGVSQPLVGIVDLLIMTDREAVILDYKFSNSRKSQDDFDMNSQLPLYAYLVSCTYGIPLRNIQYGYIDIPKKPFDTPTLLSNGTLSRSKSQNVSAEMYEKSVIAIHGEDPKYNCKPGGYYYDCWASLALNKPAYLSKQYAEVDICQNIVQDLITAAKMIDFMIENKMKFVKKYDAYSCKSCDYLEACKPWLTVHGGE